MGNISSYTVWWVAKWGMSRARERVPGVDFVTIFNDDLALRALVTLSGAHSAGAVAKLESCSSRLETLSSKV